MERILLLRGTRAVAPGSVPLAGRSLARREQAERFLRAETEKAAAAQRERLRAAVPDRRREIAVATDLRASRLLRRRLELARQTPPDREAIGEIAREQAALAASQRDALRTLAEAPDRVRAGDSPLLLHALVVPPAEAAERERPDPEVEKLALGIARRLGRGSRRQGPRRLAAGAGARPGTPRLAGLRPALAPSRGEDPQHRGQGPPPAPARCASPRTSGNGPATSATATGSTWCTTATPRGRACCGSRTPFRKLLARRAFSEGIAVSAGAIREAAEAP